MSDASPGIRVVRSRGEQFRKALVELRALDWNRKISSNRSHVYLPVLEMDEAAISRLRQIADFERVEMSFDKEEQRPSPEELLGYHPSFEVVGDIAIVDDAGAEQVASVLMSSSKSIRAVIAPVSDVEGEYRVRRFRHVAGEARTITTHRENGLRYRVDLEGAYFTPRLATERLRIAGLVRPGEMVLDMFAGVGPFALLLAKRGAKVIAVDKNPVAVQYLRENALLNRLEIEILEGDAADLALAYENKAHHVIMNLPHSASRFLPKAIASARSGGVVHYYAIAPEENLFGDVALIRRAAEQSGASFEVLYQGVVRSYAPRRYNVVIDFRVNKPQASSQT